MKKKIILVTSSILLLFLNAFSFYQMYRFFHVSTFFRPTCSIQTLKDLEYCYQNNRHVLIQVEEFYETGYHLTKDGNEYAKIIDIGIEGKTLLSIVPSSQYPYLEKKGKLAGYLDVIDDKVIQGMKQEIEREYMERLELSEEEIQNIFIPVLLNSYQYHNTNILVYGYIILFLGSAIGIIYCGMKINKE